MTVIVSGEMMPWVDTYDGDSIRVKMDDPTLLQSVITELPEDNFLPLRNGIARIKPPMWDGWTDWKTKIAKLRGKQVDVVVTPRRFDGESFFEGPEHGWDLNLVSIAKKKIPYKAKIHQKKKGRKT